LRDQGAGAALRLRERRVIISLPMPTTRQVLEAAIALEKRSMSVYARFAKAFAADQRMADFWFGMARDEARHLGALELVRTLLDFEGILDRVSPVTLDQRAVARLSEILERGVREANDLTIEAALKIALEIEQTELEDKVGDLLKALKQHDEYERFMRLLVHDLGELSYMIEQYCHNPEMLKRCDELIERRAETLRISAAN